MLEQQSASTRQALADALRVNSTLRSINLEFQFITGKGAEAWGGSWGTGGHFKLPLPKSEAGEI
jgi:hypothetical protein